MSFYWTATVYDKIKGGKFRLKVNEDQVRFYPLDDCDLGTWLRFHEFVVENIDTRAEIVVDEASSIGGKNDSG